MHIEHSTAEIEESLEPIAEDWFPQVASEAARLARFARPEGVAADGYFGIPLLKQPTWRWQIAWYFFLEGISAGSFLISGLSELLGKRRWSRLSRTGFYISFASLVPCPLLLISDLGDPKRFHHMLRIFKPLSPMSVGSWTLMIFGAPLTALVLKQAAEDFGLSGASRSIADGLPRRALVAAGIPGALTMCCYTGVLLSTTSNPLWHRSRYLGPLFACAAFSTGVSAFNLAARLASKKGIRTGVFRRIHEISTLSEMGTAAAYLASSGKAGAPLLKGRHGVLLMAGIAAMSAPLFVSKIPHRRSRRKLVETAAAALALAGGLALKWAIVYSGRISALKSNSAQLSTVTGHSSTD